MKMNPDYDHQQNPVINQPIRKYHYLLSTNWSLLKSLSTQCMYYFLSGIQLSLKGVLVSSFCVFPWSCMVTRKFRILLRRTVILHSSFQTLRLWESTWGTKAILKQCKTTSPQFIISVSLYPFVCNKVRSNQEVT